MIKSKRGASQAVAWVLLMGLSISLAILVGTWSRERVERVSEGVTEDTLVDVKCADTIFYGVANCEGNPALFNSANITNSGLFAITKVKCGGSDVYFNGDQPIMPGEIQKKVLNNCGAGLSVVVMIPFVEIDGKEYGCAEKSLRLEC